MEHYQDYFKCREEVEEFFKDEVFKFSFMSSNKMYFESLNAKFLGDELVSYQLSFYFEEGEDFFAYSSLKDWLIKHQLSEVVCTSEETIENVVMYFEKYVDFKDN